MATFVDKETENKFYKEILSPDISDQDKLCLIQDYMLVYYDENIDTHYALTLLRVMGCDAESFKENLIEQRPAFLLESANNFISEITKRL